MAVPAPVPVPVANPAVAVAEQAGGKEAEAARLRDEIVAVIETHLRKGSAPARADDAEDEEMGDEELEGEEEEEEEEEDFDEKPRAAAGATGKAKSRK
jgi:hypothetical protein